MGGYSLQIYILHIVLLTLPISKDVLKTNNVLIIIIYAIIVLIGLTYFLDKISRYKITKFLFSR